MAKRSWSRNGAKIGLRIIGFVPVLLLLGIFGTSVVIVAVPGFGSETDNFRNAVYETDRTIFTTYFYWYRATGNLEETQQVIYNCNSNTVSTIMKNLQSPPQGWPGPTNASIGQIISFNATGDGKNYTEGLSHHPLAAPPTYNATGEVIGTLDRSLSTFTTDTNDVIVNMTSWLDWMNPAWHEWEMRGMMRAGIDVAMPVYWWTGLESNLNAWAHEGLIVLNNTITTLQNKLIAEHAAGSTYTSDDVPKLAMFYDTTLMKMLWSWNISNVVSSIYYNNFSKAMNEGPGADLTDPYWANQFYLRIQEFFDVVINGNACHYVTIKQNGILEDYCVVWLYGGGYFEEVGSRVLDYCKEQFELRYGKKLLIVGGGEWGKAAIDGECGWGACCGARLAKSTRIPVGGYGPGYYNIGTLLSQKASYIARDITRYKQGLQSVIDSGAAWIHLETWNELLEGTDICWTQENGYDHIDATREIADMFHAMSGQHPLAIREDLVLVIAPITCLIVLAGIAIVLQKRRPTGMA